VIPFLGGSLVGFPLLGGAVCLTHNLSVETDVLYASLSKETQI
jgi:TRAP-type mannitol/chloroaromatic compound transport system permease small subunit